MIKRGRILRDTNVGPGLLTVEGKQYSFVLEDMWVSDFPPRTGMPVEVRFNAEGAPATVSAVSTTPFAPTQSAQAARAVEPQGSMPPASLHSRPAVFALLAEALLLLSFFLLPNLRVAAGFGERALNGWDAIGLDTATLAPTAHGLQNLLALACLFAPVGVPFVRAAWSRWLYVLPFAFTVLAFLTLYTEIQSAENQSRQAVGDLFGSEATRQMSNAMAGNFSLGVGAYLVLLCSTYLLTRTLKTRSSITAPSECTTNCI